MQNKTCLHALKILLNFHIIDTYFTTLLTIVIPTKLKNVFVKFSLQLPLLLKLVDSIGPPGIMHKS